MDAKVQGFCFSGESCGIKKTQDKDIGLIFSEVPAVSAGVFTKNLVKAATVRLDMEHIKTPNTRAIIVNSGNANACTGAQGDKDAYKMAELTATRLKINPNEVMVASTGVIGELLPMNKIESGIESVCKNYSSEKSFDFTKAIMTTDSFPKKSETQITLNGKTINILGIAKGAGMICPNMATLLCFVVTDADIEKTILQKSLHEAVDKSFNLITVDTDTSTNDSVIVLANGLAKNNKITSCNEDYNLFTNALTKIVKELAFMIVKDGEGATKFITITVKNAKTIENAKQVGMSVAKSSLVKTAFFGEDANWGRIICAVGYSGVELNPEKIDIFIGNENVVFKGEKAKNISEANLKNILKNKEINVLIDLKDGSFSEDVYTCDLTYDYVKINGSYRT